MKRLTSIRLGGSTIKYASYLLLSLLLIPNQSLSQCLMPCNDKVQISIESDCNANITPDALLEGTAPTDSYTIKFDNGEIGVAATNASFFTGIDWSTLIGETGYTITANNCSNSCWGKAVVEQNVFPVFDVDVACDYIPAQEGSMDVELTSADLATGVDVEITLPNCNPLGVTPFFSIEGDLNFPCISDPSGWCTLKCTATIQGVAVPDGDNLIWTVEINPTDIALATEYLATAGTPIVCKLNYTQAACIPCSTWCGGTPPEFVTIDSLKRLIRMTAGDCVNNIANLREVVKTEGEVCDGINTIVETYGDFTQHGVTESRLLLSQAYTQLPLPLFGDDGELKKYPDPAGVDVYIFPGKETVDCGESTDPVDMESVPVFHNFWKEVVTYPDTCLEVHYLVAVDTVREAIEIVPGVWSVQDVVKKELRDSMRCAPDSTPTSAIQINPFEPLYPSKFCNLLSSYSDHETPICGAGKKIIRDWTIVDWCKAKIVTESQVIEEKDTTPPVGPDNSVTHTVGTQPWTCVPAFDITYPVFTDNCDSDLDIKFDIINDEGIWVPVEALQPGTYFIDFTAKDDCNNTSKAHRDTLVVVDNVPPIAVCKDKLVVSITPDVDGGVAKILADDFDKGSHDGGCGVITKKQVIRFEDFIESVDHAFGGMSFAGLPVTCDPITGEVSIVDKDKFGDDLPPSTGILSKWGDYVKFCCADLEADNPVLLRVWDSANNYNDCIVNVEVQDKTLFSCPEDVTIMCTEYSKDIVFGMADLNLVCADGTTTYEDDATGLNSCGSGRVVRIWSSVNGSGTSSSCPQIITVEQENVFDPLKIRWPIHYKGGEPEVGVRLEVKDSVCIENGEVEIAFHPMLDCLDSQPMCSPEYPESQACGLVGISAKLDTLSSGNNACLKILKRWTVIDWCTWAPNGNPNASNVGDDENDTDADQFQIVEDWCLSNTCIVENEGSKYYRYKRDADGNGYVDRDGYYTYDQIILYNDELGPEFMSMEIDTTQPGTEGSCLGNIALVNTARDQGLCGSQLLQWYVTLLDASGDQYGSIQTGIGNAYGFSVSDIPLGDYTLVWNVKDGCGNSASQETEVTLEDTSKPTPICIQNISTAVMNTNGEVEIWAADFDPDGKSFDPCDDDVFYSFSPDSIVANLLLTCADVIGDSQEYKMWVHDATGNASYCRVNIRVDANGVCDDHVECTTEGGKFVTDVTDQEEVTVCISGDNSGFSAKAWETVGDPSWLTTDADGNIVDIPVGPDFDFAGENTGVCYLWHMSSMGPIRNVEVGYNVSEIGGCYSLSNPIIVTKIASGDACSSDGSSALIAGSITTPFGESIEAARVMLNNTEISEYPISQMTNGTTGNYAFSSNPMYSDYTVSAEKDDDHMNGVSTLDLVYIQHHILGLKPLDSAYKVIAADVNNDHKVSASDLVELRKLILGIIGELPKNDSWRFVDENQTFTSTYNPWPLTEILNVSDLSSDMLDQNLLGIKIGDVNGTAKPSSLSTSEVRSSENISFHISERSVNTGDVVELEFSSSELEEVSGFQFTMAHTGLELIGITSDILDINAENIANHGAMSSVSWNTTEPVTTIETFMTMVFVATESHTALSEVISLNDRITDSQIYTGYNFDVKNINIEFDTNTEKDAEFELLQNEPNPFAENTVIGFKLPKSEIATLKLFDVSGRLIHSQSGQFNKGLNKITISSDLIGSGGLIYYSLESGNYSATRKMILLK